MDEDTIVAIATPPGRGGVGILRLSGPRANAVATHLLRGSLPPARLAQLRALLDVNGTAIDSGLVLVLPAPASYTGEDTVELHAHGSPVVLDLLVQHALDRGARPARPGEFTERAFLNGRLDLAQAEAVADLISASSEAGVRSAARTMAGALSVEVNALAERLGALRVHIEASIDFPDEDAGLPGADAPPGGLADLQAMFDTLQARIRQGVLLQEGLRVVLCGAPNVGKSSLMNALSGRDTALVTAVPGTTRDVLREALQFDGLPVLLMDTAGLRDSDDPVERLGVQRARDTLEQADVALLLVDDARGWGAAERRIMAELPSQLPCIQVFNKVDLSGGPAGLRAVGPPVMVGVSAHSQVGFEALREVIGASAGHCAGEEGVYIARRRHLHALQRAAAHVRIAVELVSTAVPDIVLVAEELRLAQQQLGELVGRFTTEDLLAQIFATFCIGK